MYFPMLTFYIGRIAQGCMVQRIVVRHCLAGRKLHINFVTELDFRCGKAAANAPVIGWNFTQQNFYMIGGNAKWSEILHDRSV
jgi:hypothetical protein